MAGGVAVPMADAVEVEALPPAECGGGESGRSPTASTEFEFWMVGKNPSPALLTADELFSGGVVLPLRTLQASSPTDADGDDGAEAPDTEAARPLAESGVAPTPDLPAVTFKWKDIFKANGGGGGEGKERKKTERRVSSVSGNAELININIWPFSRSRSAGAAVSLSRGKPSPSPSATTNNNNGVVSNANSTASAPASTAPVPAAREVSSAPCSRSNSRGETGPEPASPAAAAPAAAVEEPAGGGGAQPHVQVKEVKEARTRLRTFFSKKVY